jgi:hypothetical protein
MLMGSFSRKQTWQWRTFHDSRAPPKHGDFLDCLGDQPQSCHKLSKVMPYYLQFYGSFSSHKIWGCPIKTATKKWFDDRGIILQFRTWLCNEPSADYFCGQ